ncbi:hypothetical protein [Kitasatospora phosalacinea]|nr:hypothetical protein [Kitasatospora phosalacinea]
MSGSVLADLCGDAVMTEVPFAPPRIPRRTETARKQLRAPSATC